MAESFCFAPERIQGPMTKLLNADSSLRMLVVPIKFGQNVLRVGGREGGLSGRLWPSGGQIAQCNNLGAVFRQFDCVQGHQTLDVNKGVNEYFPSERWKPSGKANILAHSSIDLGFAQSTVECVPDFVLHLGFVSTKTRTHPFYIDPSQRWD